MKKLIYIFILIQLLPACTTKIQTTNESSNSLSFEKNDSDEYDIIVLDTGYDYYLKTIAQPESFHSEEFYKTRNAFYVNEWNLRNSQPQMYDPNFYSTYIDYDPSFEYGLHFEYKLYTFFKYLEWKYKVRF